MWPLLKSAQVVEMGVGDDYVSHADVAGLSQDSGSLAGGVNDDPLAALRTDYNVAIGSIGLGLQLPDADISVVMPAHLASSVATRLLFPVGRLT